MKTKGIQFVKASTPVLKSIAVATVAAFMMVSPFQYVYAGGGDSAGSGTISSTFMTKEFIERDVKKMVLDPNGLMTIVLKNLDSTFNTFSGSKDEFQSALRLENGMPLYSILPEINFTFERDSDCVVVTNGKTLTGDAVAWTEGVNRNMCVSSGNLSKKLLDSSYVKQIVMLLAHELSHLGGADEITAKQVENYVLSYGSFQNTIEAHDLQAGDEAAIIEAFLEWIDILKEILENSPEKSTHLIGLHSAYLQVYVTNLAQTISMGHDKLITKYSSNDLSQVWDAGVQLTMIHNALLSEFEIDQMSGTLFEKLIPGKFEYSALEFCHLVSHTSETETTCTKENYKKANFTFYVPERGNFEQVAIALEKARQIIIGIRNKK